MPLSSSAGSIARLCGVGFVGLFACGGVTVSGGSNLPDAGSIDAARVVEASAPLDTGPSLEASTAPDATARSVRSCVECSAGEVCMVSSGGGDACLPPDRLGVCPNGVPESVEGCCTSSPPGFACMPTPPSCGAAVTCDCVRSLCRCECTGVAGSTFGCGCFSP